MSTDIEQKVNERKRTAIEANLNDVDDTITEQDLELKEFECPRCDQVYDSTTTLYTHMRKEYRNPTICHICNKNLNALPNILSHSYIHKNTKPYKCPNQKKCKYTSRTRYNLKVHLASCAGIDKFRPNKRNRIKKLKVTKNENDDISTDYTYNNIPPLIPEFEWSTNNMNIPFAPSIFNDFSNFNHFGMDVSQIAPKQDILNEIKESGPVQDVSRDTTFLVLLHKDYIPPKSRPFQIKEPMYHPQCQSMSSEASKSEEFANFKQYIDLLYCAPML